MRFVKAPIFVLVLLFASFIPLAAQDTITCETGFRAFVDALNKVCVPATPQRIVAHFYASDMIALDLPLVGTNFVNASQVLTTDQLQGVTDIGNEPNVETILSLNPDLIFVPDFTDPGIVAEVAKIAPTVIIPYAGDPFERLHLFGEIVGKPQAADAWIDAFQAKAAAQREEVSPLIKQDETATAFIMYGDDQFYIYGRPRLGPIMYDVFGFKQPAKVTELFQDDPNALWKAISIELLPEYVGDRIFLVKVDNEDAKKATDALLNSPIWQSLPAVKNGNVYYVNGRWAFNDPLTLDWLIDEMASVLKAQQQTTIKCEAGFHVFVDARGEVCVPQTPKRIVATHDVNAGVQVLSLGGPLVGLASRGGSFSPDITKFFDLTGIEDIGEYYEPSIERILELKPDLIVHEGYSGTLYFNNESTLAALEAIAPVVAIDAFRPVEEVMADYQELLGDSATIRLEDQKAEFDGVIDDIRGVLGDKWDHVTASLLIRSETGVAAWGPTALVPNDILTRVGVSWVEPQMKAGLKENGGFLAGFSYEQINLFSADLILIHTADSTELFDNPLVQALPAVKAGQYILLDKPYFGTHYPNYIAVAKELLTDLQTIKNFNTDIVAETGS